MAVAADGEAYPHDEAGLALGVVVADGLPAGDQLEEDDAEGVDVDLLADLPVHEILWSEVAEGAHHVFLRYVGRARRRPQSKPKV